VRIFFQKIFFIAVLVILLRPISVEAVMYSAKKGVGGEGDSIATKLGISWAFSWSLCEECFNEEYEHVPMIWGKDYDPTQVSHLARQHPGSHWLIWNEPNYWRQANITPTEAAQIYHDLRPLIKKADPNAKLIVGGVLYLDTGWLTDFRNEYHQLYNEWPVVEGWHVHHYVGANEYGDGKTITASEWRRRLETVRDWMNKVENGGPVELWLTEFGCLNSEPVDFQIMQDQISWLESQSWLTRYAWYATWSDGSGCPGCTGSLLESNAPYNLTRLGQYYASIGSSRPPSPTATPLLPPSPTITPSFSPSLTLTLTPTVTISICPGGDQGNLNCDSRGLINDIDLGIFLGSWAPFGPVPTPQVGQHTADLNGDNKVDESDLTKLLGYWKTQ